MLVSLECIQNSGSEPTVGAHGFLQGRKKGNGGEKGGMGGGRAPHAP